MSICSGCGQENPESARFCNACGAALADEPVAPRETRKTVTIVFADVSGSTALGERLDPESLRRIMSRYFDAMRAALERHGGTVEKFIGDAVMAVFGIPVLHEDDALRAVRAATEMREALARLNEELERDWGVRLAVRTGVNTGEVVAGDSSQGQSFATGDTVNVAARLEQAAGPDEILVGETTHRLVRDAVDVEPVEPLALKGKEAAVPAFRLLAVTPGAPGSARRPESALVGRESERALLRNGFERATRERACHLFTLLGSAGVGKSRLVEEFLASLGGGATVVRGRCLPYGEGITFWPVAEAVKDVAGLRDDDPPTEARHKVSALLAEEEDAERVFQGVAGLLGLGEPAVETGEGFWAVRRLFEALARARPLVVVFDDIHWAEATFLELVEHVADWSRGAPILLLCLARPELLDSRPGWAGGKLNAATALLEPLQDEECERLIENLLGAASLPDEARERITQAAEGNPLFVEEMVGMLIDDGLLERTNGAWTVSGDLSHVSVPPTIQALLGARLDRLEADERSAIECASVEGKVFHRSAVAELSPEASRPALGDRLLALVRKELVRPDQASFTGEEAFRFRHLLIRDAAYEALPKEFRAELHERYAGWLEGKAGDRAEEYEEILGYHLEQSYRYRAELGPVDASGLELATRAGERLARAGLRAFQRGDMTAAAPLLSRAHGLLPAGSRPRLELAPSLGEALAEVGEFSRAEAVLAEAAQAVGEPVVQLRAEMELLSLRGSTGGDQSGAEIVALTERAIPVFETAGDEAALARAWHLRSDVDWMACRWERRAEALERALVHARRAGNTRREAEALDWISISLFYGPTPAPEALGRCEELLATATARVDAGTLLTISGLQAMRGRFEEARRFYRDASRINAELGLTVRNAGYVLGSAFVERLAGDLSAAETELRQGYETLEALGEKGLLSSVAGELGMVLFEQGRYEEAGRIAEVSRAAADAEDIISQVLWRLAQGRLCAVRGEPEEAERLAQEAVALIEATDMLQYHGEALMALAEILHRAGRREEARSAVEEALRLFERKGNVVSAAKARAALAELGAG